MKKRVFILLLLGIIFLSFAITDDANAIPTFARKYRTSCTTCHIGFNKLNAFGEAYRLNGFSIPEGDAVYIKEEPVSLGAPAWKKVWPETVWPGAIPGMLPISFMVHQRINIQQDDETSTVDFNMPHEFEMLLGGTFGDFASFFGEYVFDEDGNLEGLEQMFIQFNDLFYDNFGSWLPENAFNLKIGRFSIAAEPFHDPTRRTLSHLNVNNLRVGESSWRFRDYQSGIEANGIVLSRLFYALGIVNGSGTVLDDNQQKDGYYRLSYKIGGTALDGSRAGESGDELIQKDNWVDNSLTFGTYGYWGTSNVTNAAGHTRTDNQFYRIGGDARFDYENLSVYGAAFHGRDQKAFVNTIRGVDSYAWFVGADYVIYQWLMCSTRYENEGVGGGQTDDQRYIASIIMYPRENIRCIVEIRHFPESDGVDDGNNLLQMDVTYLF